MFKWLKLPYMLLATIFTLALAGCASDEEAVYSPQLIGSKQAAAASADKVYTFGIHPLHNPNRLHEVFGPVMEYLSDNIEGASFKLEASRNYAAYDEKLYAGKFEFSLPNPFQTINSRKHGYRVFGKMGDDDNFRGIILVRKDSGIEKIEDLKGKAVSYPAPTALAATMMPQYYLQTHGLDVMKDLDNRYVGSQESSVMNVFLKDTVAGATWPPPWHALVKERPELAEQMEIKWQTKPLLNNGLVARGDMDPALVEQVVKLLTTMHDIEAGRVMLERMELSRFERATDATYQPVVDFVEVFSKTVRKLD